MADNLSDTEVLVSINGIAVGGAAVGRVTGPDGSPSIGMAAFVPFAAPGETVRARVTKRENRFLEAELIAVETASPHRVEPPCPYFGDCGGCSLQHLSYPAQLDAKRDMVVGAFRAGKFDAAFLERIAPVVASPPYGYRQRITLHIGRQSEIGYFRRKSHSVLPIQQCPISVPEIERVLAENLSLSEHPVTVGGELFIEAGENGVFAEMRLVRRPNPASLNRLQEWLTARFAGGIIAHEQRLLVKFGAASVQRRVRGDITQTPPGGFAQNNAVINEALVSKVCEIARDAGARTACDLYTGAGNFALPLAADGLNVIAVEIMGDLIAAGQAEANRRELSERMQFVMTSVEDFLLQRTRPADMVVADPPRGGLGPLAKRLDFCKTLCLVSCHLPSAVRDVRDLQESGWRVAEIIPYDMFPQTAYVELLTLLRRD